MKVKINAFIEQLIPYDYMLFGATLLLFILLLILAILLHRRTGFAALMVILAFTVLMTLPTVGYLQLHAYLFKNSTTIENYRALEFTEALIVHGKLTNESDLDFSECAVTAGVYKIAHNPVLDLLYPLNPFKKETIVTKEVLSGQTVAFKIIVDPFRYSRDYNLSVGAKCR